MPALLFDSSKILLPNVPKYISAPFIVHYFEKHFYCHFALNGYRLQQPGHNQYFFPRWDFEKLSYTSLRDEI